MVEKRGRENGNSFPLVRTIYPGPWKIDDRYQSPAIHDEEQSEEGFRGIYSSTRSFIQGRRPVKGKRDGMGRYKDVFRVVAEMDGRRETQV